RGRPDQEDIQRAQEGLDSCRKAMLSGQYQIVVLDEIHVALHFQLLSEEEIHKFLDQKPENVEIILTGRYALESILQRADLVTEMKEIKHYYQKNVGCRDGIER
ncbi:cob(I)yrinic acid a,c-diamide adenosyltransferase, partial [bacterium]|nr:cob(I)yrinic acid a,c-diamide adenosyltransferase [bacterium]